MTSTHAPQHESPAAETPSGSQQSWNYPTRTCRVCLEEVPATVTLYPPGLPPAFQRPIIEYKNEDEYGRLVKPCHCRGGMRYIHELCLRRLRTESVRPGSLWKCHQCGYKFNFNRLTIQKYLDSRISSGVLTMLVMLGVMFILGFIADPILNLYADPYETLVGHEDVWQTVSVNDPRGTSKLSGWAQHFTKGMVSMGLLSFLRTMILNPFQWWNLRNTGFVSSRVSGRSATGRDRAVNISWIAVAMGILSASYFFYKFVQTIIGKSLQRIGNNIVDTQLPGDDEDLKPPPGWKFENNSPDTSSSNPGTQQSEMKQPESNEETRSPKKDEGESVERDPMPGTWHSSAYSSALDDAQSQGWSFVDL